MITIDGTIDIIDIQNYRGNTVSIDRRREEEMSRIVKLLRMITIENTIDKING